MAESQDWGKMSPGSLCEKEEKGRNLIVYVLITEQSSNLPKRFAFLCQSGRIRSFMCVRGDGGKKRQRWVDFLALDNEMFSPYSTITPPFFQPSSRFFFFFARILLLPQTHLFASSSSCFAPTETVTSSTKDCATGCTPRKFAILSTSEKTSVTCVTGL